MKNESKTITKVFWEASALILFSIMLALLSNFLRSDGLSLTGGNVGQQQLVLSDEDLVIPLQTAQSLFEDNAA